MHEDAKFWKAAMLDKMVNYEEVFGSFGPPIPRTHEMKVTPTRFLLLKKIVSLQEETGLKITGLQVVSLFAPEVNKT